MKRLLAALAATVAFALPSSAATIGYDAIDRGHGDNYSNFVMALTDIKFIDGIVTGWDVFIERIDGPVNQVTIMALTAVGVADYRVDGIDTRSVVQGLNQFTGLSASVSSNSVLGIAMADAKVSFDLISQPGGPDLYTSNNYLTGAPNNGDVINFAGGTTRKYSVNATIAPIPVPAGLPLLVTGLGLFVMVKRRKTKNRQAA